MQAREFQEDKAGLLTGRFGEFGGQFVAETLMPAIKELETEFHNARQDPAFLDELNLYLRDYIGRPSPLFHARRMSKHLGGPKIYLKREDLNHTGAHKVNNTIGQALLAKRMGKTRIIAETGAGQHGVATATAAALFGIKCEIFMGEKDMSRQQENVKRMRLLGANVIQVRSGTKTLKDAMNDAMRNWIATVDHTFYIIGSVAGPHPYPVMVREFQRVIGEETRVQILEKEGRLPDFVIACIGGGSNSMGIFASFLKDEGVKLIGVEAAGEGVKTGNHAASIAAGSVGVLHGSKSYLLQTDDGQVQNAHSISAGLDYPGVGPEHAWLYKSGRVDYASVTDYEAVNAFQHLAGLEGILPALESSHAVAHVFNIAPKLSNSDLLVINISGRGDKDMESVTDFLAGPQGERIETLKLRLTGNNGSN